VPGGKTKQLWRAIVNSREDKLQGRTWSKAFRERRCLIPTAACYKWTGGPAGQVPPRSERPGEERLWTAGIWDQDKEPGECFSMITIEPNDVLAPGHDRMPAVLGYQSIACTDHDGFYGDASAHSAAQEAGLRAIVGTTSTQPDGSRVPVSCATGISPLKLARIRQRGRTVQEPAFGVRMREGDSRPASLPHCLNRVRIRNKRLHEKAPGGMGPAGAWKVATCAKTQAFFTSTHCLVFADSSTASQTYCVPRAWRKSG